MFDDIGRRISLFAHYGGVMAINIVANSSLHLVYGVL